MRILEQWIWLPQNEYPDCRETMIDRYDPNYKRNYVVAQFKKDAVYSKPIKKVNIVFSGDTSVTLCCNDKFIGRGPASPGGDFLSPQLPHSNHYATQVELYQSDYQGFTEGKLSFQSTVRMSEARLFEFSEGHGGFFLTAHIFFADGSKEILITDETWYCRYLPEYTDVGIYNNDVSCEPWVKAEKTRNIWHCETAPIAPCTEKYIHLGDMEIEPNKKTTASFELDMIYAGYPVLKVSSIGNLTVRIFCREWKESGTEINCKFAKDGTYQATELYSAGELYIEAENSANTSAKVEIGFITSHYPITTQAKTVTSDSELNNVLDTCVHTLKYCRQTLHLDSPRHCELLACTGDYYIESLMTAFSFGDQSLSEFDIRRTAELLRYRNGEMFHVTYSLIWVQMLWDIYMLTGNKSLLLDCEDALRILLRKFKTYIGETDLIETPPSFMFIDWLFPDSISMHHPPKALGQTCLNLFYYGALKTAVKIYTELGINADDEKTLAENIHSAILLNLYDEQKGLFFEGLNTPTPNELVNEDMPQNTQKRYYLKHSGILAAYFDFFHKEKNRELLRKIINNKSMPEVQPYFCHFLLEAIYRNGMRDEFTLSVLEQWKEPVRECSKGLVEGFYKPEPTYSFDHSHAWGGTPAWSLPLALSGMEIQEPGMKRLSFNPSLLGLKEATVEIPTPHGIVTLKLKENCKPEISAPKDIEITLI